MIRAAVGIALLLGSSWTLAGQNGANHELQSLVLWSNGSVLSCPIGMYASHGVWDHTIRIRGGDKEALQDFGQKISLTLRDFHTDRIVAGTVRVQGLTGKNHMLHIQTGTARNWESTKTLKVTFAEQPDRSVSGDLWIGGFTSITSVQLLEATYADGSVWRISGQDSCSVKPDPMMLITNR